MAGYSYWQGRRIAVEIPRTAFGISHSDGQYSRGAITSRNRMESIMSFVSIFDQWKLLREWGPVLGYGQAYLAETDPHKRALVIGDAAEWLVAKTENKLDDRYVAHIVAILKSPEGEALVRDVVADLSAVSSAVQRSK